MRHFRRNSLFTSKTLYVPFLACLFFKEKQLSYCDSLGGGGVVIIVVVPKL